MQDKKEHNDTLSSEAELLQLGAAWNPCSLNPSSSESLSSTPSTHTTNRACHISPNQSKHKHVHQADFASLRLGEPQAPHSQWVGDVWVPNDPPDATNFAAYQFMGAKNSQKVLPTVPAKVNGEWLHILCYVYKCSSPHHSVYIGMPFFPQYNIVQVDVLALSERGTMATLCTLYPDTETRNFYNQLKFRVSKETLQLWKAKLPKCDNRSQLAVAQLYLEQAGEPFKKIILHRLFCVSTDAETRFVPRKRRELQSLPSHDCSTELQKMHSDDSQSIFVDDKPAACVRCGNEFILRIPADLLSLYLSQGVQMLCLSRIQGAARDAEAKLQAVEANAVADSFLKANPDDSCDSANHDCRLQWSASNPEQSQSFETFPSDIVGSLHHPNASTSKDVLLSTVQGCLWDHEPEERDDSREQFSGVD